MSQSLEKDDLQSPGRTESLEGSLNKLRIYDKDT